MKLIRTNATVAEHVQPHVTRERSPWWTEKRRLMRDDYCDGLGDCLPACPTGAITFVEREAVAYDEAAVMANKQKMMQEKMRKEGMTLPCGCPGTKLRRIEHNESEDAAAMPAGQVSRLSQWPVQIKLVPVNAPYFDGAKLLIAADWHGICRMRLFMRGLSKATLRLSAVRSWTAWIMPIS